MSKIILKISGEALKTSNQNVSEEKLNIVLNTINILKKYNHEIGIVIGGGNFFRGRDHEEMDLDIKSTIGMLGTVTNALYLEDYLLRNNCKCLVTTPFDFPNLIPNYTKEDLDSLAKDNVIIFGGGLGKSGYSTDSGAVMAAETLNSSLIIKLTNVDGVYSDDPKVNPEATFYQSLTYQDILQNNLKIMDAFAIEECGKQNIKVLVMNFAKYLDLEKFFNNESIGTLIGGQNGENNIN